MKYPLFEHLIDDYPTALEQHYERILKKIVELWNEPEIDDYFTTLTIDNRGGRRGFEDDVFNDIQRLRKFRESERLRKSGDKLESIRELERRGIEFRVETFLQTIHDGDQSLVDLFVRAGINIHTHDELGNPAIIIALKNGYTVIANILLTAGANPNVCDGLGLTPLLLALSAGTVDVIELLLEYGANPLARTRKGEDAVSLAKKFGRVELIN
jgi:tankyrase